MEACEVAQEQPWKRWKMRIVDTFYHSTVLSAYSIINDRKMWFNDKLHY